jgi:chromosome segregation ATPase
MDPSGVLLALDERKKWRERRERLREELRRLRRRKAYLHHELDRVRKKLAECNNLVVAAIGPQVGETLPLPQTPSR